MKIVKGLMASAAIAMLAAQPVAANSASKLSLSNAVKSDVRASAKAGKNKAAAGIPLIAIIAGVAVVVGIVVIASDGDSN